MRTTTKTTAFEMTPALEAYLQTKLDDIAKFIDKTDESVLADIELGKTTRHHKSGDVFKAEMTLHIAGKYLRTDVVTEDVYAAIDQMKDEMVSQLTSYNKRKNSLVKRGGRAIKNLLRGFYLKS